MSLIEIVILIVSVVCFFEWKELKSNNIRHDEMKFFIIGILFLILFLMLIYIDNQTTLPQIDD